MKMPSKPSPHCGAKENEKYLPQNAEGRRNWFRRRAAWALTIQSQVGHRLHGIFNLLA